jgi:hypothetical protein
VRLLEGFAVRMKDKEVAVDGFIYPFIGLKGCVFLASLGEWL